MALGRSYPEPNQQDFLKSLAIFVMIIDHIGLYFLPKLSILRAIGRLAFAIFAFYAGYNFKGRVNSKILYCGLLVQIVHFYFTKQIYPGNILISIFLGQIYLYIIFRKLSQDVIFLSYIFCLIFWFGSRLFFEYGLMTMLFMLIGMQAKNRLISLKAASGQICLFSVIMSSIIFGRFFTIMDYIVLITSHLFLLIVINSKIKWPDYRSVTLISRNSLYIYTIHVILFQIWWKL